MAVELLLPLCIIHTSTVSPPSITTTTTVETTTTTAITEDHTTGQYEVLSQQPLPPSGIAADPCQCYTSTGVNFTSTGLGDTGYGVLPTADPASNTARGRVVPPRPAGPGAAALLSNAATQQRVLRARSNSEHRACEGVSDTLITETLYIRGKLLGIVTTLDLRLHAGRGAVSPLYNLARIRRMPCIERLTLSRSRPMLPLRKPEIFYPAGTHPAR